MRPHGLERVDADALQQLGKDRYFAQAFVVKVEQQDATFFLAGCGVFFHHTQGDAVRANELRVDVELFQRGDIVFSFDENHVAVQGCKGFVQSTSGCVSVRSDYYCDRLK